ncbi:MAG: hypothetical protein K0U86_14535 [Planctomycetes bacterium]|nr:hypothetical protein [Planctomycetota bacterium]MCH9726113.1 hypothetical protein [Planctomycetota bacterium]MCH9777265.1 hypothetical protein [Planctomycetota bacterium]MCH9792879.1 hypothetical protein [Planctomycetota bacterium]
MTAQINDSFRHNDTEFSLSGISEGELFEPSLLDLNPAGTCTACWRGYQAIFAVSNSHLVLDTLHVNLIAEGEGYEPQVGPQINGVTPTGTDGEFDWFNNHYEGLDYHLEYSGGLLITDGFIQDLYVHMGFHAAWKYKSVIELIFANGILQQEFDRSERMAEIRERMIQARNEDVESKMPSDDEIHDFVERSFDRTYRM